MTTAPSPRPPGFSWGRQDSQEVVEYLGMRVTSGNLRERVYHVMVMKGGHWNRAAMEAYAKSDEGQDVRITSRGGHLQAVYRTGHGSTGVLAMARQGDVVLLELDAERFQLSEFDGWVDSYRAEKYTAGKAGKAAPLSATQSGRLSLEQGSLQLPSGLEWHEKTTPIGKVHVGARMGEESLDYFYLIAEMDSPMKVSEESAKEYLAGMMESQSLRHEVVNVTRQDKPFRDSERVDFQVLSETGQKSPGVLVLSPRLAMVGFGQKFQAQDLDAVVNSFEPAPGAELASNPEFLGTVLLFFGQAVVVGMSLFCGMILSLVAGRGLRFPWWGARAILLATDLVIFVMFATRSPANLTPHEAGERLGSFGASLFMSCLPFFLGLSWLHARRQRSE